MKHVVALLPLLLLPACASIIEGTSQDIAISSNPECVRCELKRNGEIVGSVACTPETVTVKKRKYDIEMTCYKEGYRPTSQILASGTEGYVAGNIIAGGVIGWGIDSATGADNKYPEQVIINMLSDTAPASAALQATTPAYRTYPAK